MNKLIKQVDQENYFIYNIIKKQNIKEINFECFLDFCIILFVPIDFSYEQIESFLERNKYAIYFVLLHRLNICLFDDYFVINGVKYYQQKITNKNNLIYKSKNNQELFFKLFDNDFEKIKYLKKFLMKQY